jgi:hypothetical protein
MRKNKDDAKNINSFAKEIVDRRDNLGSLQKYENDQYHIIVYNGNAQAFSSSEEEKSMSDEDYERKLDYIMKMTGESLETLKPKLMRLAMIRLISEEIDKMASKVGLE